MLISKDKKEVKDLAHGLAHPQPNKKIIEITRRSMGRCYEELMREYHEVLARYDFLKLIDTMPIQRVPVLQFELLHSSLPYILKSLQRSGEDAGKGGRTDYLIARSKEIFDSLDAVVKRMGGREPHYHIYEIEEGKQRIDLFPSPGVDHLLPYRKDSSYREFIDKAKFWVHKWKPEVVQEVDLFIRDYAISDVQNGNLISESVEYDPGHIKLYPRVMLKQAGMLDYEGSDTEAILLAAELIRESRRQKIYYFNRILDVGSKHMPNALVKEDAQKKEITVPAFQGDTMVILYEQFLALGFEIMFFEFFIKSDPLDEYPSALEIRLEEKKEIFHSVVKYIHQHKDQLTELGVAVLKELL